MDSILPKQLDSAGFTESAQGFLTEVAPADTSLRSKIAMAVAVGVLGAAAYYGYRLATRTSKPVNSDDAKKA